jgi:MFS family permease
VNDAERDTPAGSVRIRHVILANRTFTRLFAAQAFSSLGDRMFPVVATLILLNHGASAAEIGFALASRVVAIVIVALLGSIVAEHWPRRLVLAGSSLTQLIAASGLLLPTSTLSIAVPFAIFFVGGGEALFKPACRAAIPKILMREDLTVGNAAIAVAQRIAGFLGPMLAAALLTLASQTAAIVLCMIFFGIAVSVTFCGDNDFGVGARNAASVFSSLAAGFKYTASRHWMIAVLVVAGIQLSLAVAPTAVLLPIISKAHYGEYLYGAALSALAAGAIVGAIVVGRISTAFRGTLSMVGLALYACPLATLAFKGPALLIIAGFFAAGIGVEPFAIWWYAAIQSSVPEVMLGRVLSIDWILSYALQPVGMALAAPLAGRFGLDGAFLTSAGVVLLTSFGVLAVSGVARFRDPDDKLVPDSACG